MTTSNESADRDRIAVIDLDETGWLLAAETGDPVPVAGLRDYFAEQVAAPDWASDIIVYVHGWQTSRESAQQAAGRLRTLALRQLESCPANYPQLSASAFQPWTVAVRWPSASRLGLSGYRGIRDRAHAMSAGGNGHAAHVLGALLGYLDDERPDPAEPSVLANRDGQYLYLVGHSFGCRFLCEAVTWAADASLGDTLSWTTAARDRTRPFNADSMLLFQMAAPRDAFAELFADLVPAQDRHSPPIRGPIVATYSRHDRATGFWHRRAEGQPGIGHSGIDPITTNVRDGHLHPTTERYSIDELDDHFVNMDATRFYTKGRLLNPAGAHSAHLRPESAHLLLSLADYSRSSYAL